MSINIALARVNSATQVADAQILGPAKLELLALLEDNDSDLDAEGEEDWECFIPGLPPSTNAASLSTSHSEGPPTQSSARARDMSTHPSPAQRSSNITTAQTCSHERPRTSSPDALDTHTYETSSGTFRHKTDRLLHKVFDGDLSPIKKGDYHVGNQEISQPPSATVKTKPKAQNIIPVMRKPLLDRWTREEDRHLVHFMLSTGMKARLWSDITAAAVSPRFKSVQMPSEAFFEERWKDLFASLVEAHPNEYSYGKAEDQLISIVIATCLKQTSALFTQYTASQDKKGGLKRTSSAVKRRWVELKGRGIAGIMRHAEGDESLGTMGGEKGDKLGLDVKIEMIEDEEAPSKSTLKSSPVKGTDDVKPQVSRGGGHTAWSANEKEAVLKAVLDSVDINWAVVHATLVGIPGFDFRRTQAALRRKVVGYGSISRKTQRRHGKRDF
ncbi:hypothetical protein FRB96_004758 [Tulasnella sp. 330]|nr:hypothetical protein FRB96_004758 [Tulasnella sp. 330]